MDQQSQVGVSLFRFIAMLLRERNLMFRCLAGGVLVSVAIILARDTTYTTTFTFLPQTSQNENQAQLAVLASQLGFDFSSLERRRIPSLLYADLVEARPVLRAIARESFSVDGGGPWVPLSAFFEIKGEGPAAVDEKMVRKLRNDVISTTVAMASTTVVTVRVRTRSRFLSRAIGERLLEELNRFNLRVRQITFSEERRFSRARLDEAQISLRAAEDSLQRFQEANREVNSPSELQLKQDQLEREVQFWQQVVISLYQRYEEASLLEVRETPVITVLDGPNLAATHDPRLWWLILILGVVAACCTYLLIVIVRDAWRPGSTIRSDPAHQQLINELRRLGSATWGKP